MGHRRQNYFMIHRVYMVTYEFEDKAFVEWSKAGHYFVITVTATINNTRSHCDLQTNSSEPTIQESIELLNKGIRKIAKQIRETI